jgi:translation initiation factor IF-2
LFDAFQKYLAEVIEARKRDAMGDAVWPVRLSIIQAFAHRDPIILGCDIIEGSLRVGTPVGVVRIDKATKQREIIKLGKMYVHVSGGVVAFADEQYESGKGTQICQPCKEARCRRRYRRKD